MMLPHPTLGFLPHIADRCRDRCAFYGDPPCWLIPDLSSDPLPEPFLPCADCLQGIPNPDEVW